MKKIIALLPLVIFGSQSSYAVVANGVAQNNINWLAEPSSQITSISQDATAYTYHLSDFNQESSQNESNTKPLYQVLQPNSASQSDRIFKFPSPNAKQDKDLDGIDSKARLDQKIWQSNANPCYGQFPVTSFASKCVPNYANPNLQYPTRDSRINNDKYNKNRTNETKLINKKR